jgi:hypothetical protein
MNYCLYFLFVCSLFFPIVGFAATISPLAHTVTVDPGDTVTIDIRITNTQSVPIQMKPDVRGIHIDEQTGRHIVVEHTPLRGWVLPQEPLQIDPTQEVIVPYTFQIPSTATPGAYAGMLTAAISTESGQIQAEIELGSLLTVYVAGDIVESLSLRQFHIVESHIRDSQRNVLVEFENEGNIHVDVQSELIMVRPNGTEMSRIPIDITTVFSGMRRQAIVPVQIPEQHIGPLEIRIDTTYGITNKFVGASITLWHIPSYVWYGGYGVLLLVIGGIIVRSIVIKKRVI